MSLLSDMTEDQIRKAHRDALALEAWIRARSWEE